MRRILLSAMAVLCVITYSYSQTITPATLNAAGGTYNNADSYFRFEWSFGEALLIDSYAPLDSAVLLTQGVLQPCTDGKSLPGNARFQPADYSLFPNPTTGKFEVNFFIREPGPMHLRLVDASGKVLEQRSFMYSGCCGIYQFDLTDHPPGVYYVIAELRTYFIRYSGLKVMKIGK